MTSAISLLLLFAPIGQQTPSTISLGGVEVETPAPNGCQPLTPTMQPAYDLQRQFVAPTNEQFIAYLPAEEADRALAGELPDLSRTFSIQTAIKLIDKDISRAYFQNIKNGVIAKNAEKMKEVEDALPGMIEKLNQGLAERDELDLALASAEIVPFPAHQNEERSMAWSSYVTYGFENPPAGQPDSFVVAATTTLVHIRGRVVFLYSFAPKDSLAWTQDVSKDWAAALIAANPSDAATAKIENAPASVGGIDWNEVLRKGLVGAVIGAIAGDIAGMVLWVKRKLKGGPKR